MAATERGQNVSWSIPKPWPPRLPLTVASKSVTAPMIEQVLPNPVSVPQITSSWATNGLKYRSASGGRRVSVEMIPLSGGAIAWFGRSPLAVIADQKANRNVAPAVSTIVITRLITVAACVRLTKADTNRPIDPKAMAVANRTM